MESMLVRRLAGIMDNSIQVSGLHNFPESEWREAILFYLNGIWSGQQDVIDRAKIILGTVTLRLDPTARCYFAYGRGPDGWPPGAFSDDETLKTSAMREEVETGLIQFVKNDRIRQLVINLPGFGTLALSKTDKRDEYRCATHGVPESWMGLGPALPA